MTDCDDLSPEDSATEIRSNAPSSVNAQSGPAQRRDGETSLRTRFDTALYVLAHHRRRDAIRYLRDADGPVPVNDFLGHLYERAAHRRSDPDPGLEAQVVTDVLETHLPKLQRTHIVTRTDDGLEYTADPLFEDVLDAVLSASIELDDEQ